MPFARPQLTTLIDRAVADIESRLPGTDARLRRSNLNVLARVHAGAVHGLYGYLDWLSRQVIYDTAEAEWLERWASIWNIARRPAAAATGTAQFTGTDGTVIPAATLATRSDGAEFVTAAEVTIAAGVAVATVTAVLPGAGGNTDGGSALSLVSPIAGAASTATVSGAGLTAGTDAESDDSLRARLLDRIRQPPHGGARHDYVAWAQEVPGVTRVWVSPNELDVGTVTVRFVRDDDASPIPDAGEVAAVQAHLDALRPVTAEVIVVAPEAVPVDFTIALEPNDSETRAAVEAELYDLLRRQGAPGATLLISHIREAISIAAGEADHVLSAPAANVTHGTNQMPVMGAITWL